MIFAFQSQLGCSFLSDVVIIAAMETQIAAPSSFGFSSKIRYRYDVFLSFRGEDTRHPFTTPLYEALRRKGINAFIDDKRLGKGEQISPTLLKAIERSRISIIVFSKNYATSTWCLEELAHIIWCRKQKNQLVMPVFYKVDPMDVHYQRNSFGDAMAALEDRFRDELYKVQKWRFALSEAATLSLAWLFQDGYEFGFIEKIVEDAYAMLPPKRLHRPVYMVGLEPRVEQVISLLNQSDDKVCMLGIYGTGGIGKTTLAKSVYNSMFYEFEGSCFLFDVQKSSRKYQGIVRLQQKLLSEILEENIMMFGSVDEGVSRIKHRLSHKKVLLVLDDVDEIEQLEHLAGGCDWFGCGSKVIITTRNKQLLIARNIGRTYEMMKLNEHDSLELFCWRAFHRKNPPDNYKDMSSCAISYAQGLPLALRVIGSNFANNNFEEWKSILKKYEKIQEGTIHDVLKISYDCLQDGAKRLFLDIACFIDEELLESLKEIDALDVGARFYLEVLADKSLITLVLNSCFTIHDLIRQMGREIVRQEAPLNPERRSRLWNYKDALKVFRENSECNNIEGIILDPPQQEKVQWSGKAFKKMNNLRILIVRNVQFSTGPTYLPNSLRWLEWKGYPSTTLPTDFSPLELVILKLPGSCFWLKEPFKIFTNHVTQLDFSHCPCITELPEMSQCQSLRKLEFSYCHNLIKVDDSVGSLPKLVHLKALGCTKLSMFPHEIKMPLLQNLDLGNCKSLEYFPNVVGNMDALKDITIEGTAIKELPPSIGNLSRLECFVMLSCNSLEELPVSLFALPRLSVVDLGRCHPRTRKSLNNLLTMPDIQSLASYFNIKNLSLINCGVLDEELHLILTCFRNLRELTLSRNDSIVSLPECIKECAKLMSLDVRECKRLRDIPELPPKLSQIIAENCTSLTTESLDNLYSQAKKEISSLRVKMPTRTFPDWLDYCCEGATLSFRARSNLPRAALAFEVTKANSVSGANALIVSMSINGQKIDFNGPPNFAKQGHVLLDDLFINSMELNEAMVLDWNDVEISVTCDSPAISIERCGIYVYRKRTDMNNVQFKSPLLSTTSSKRRAIASPPNEPPKKLLRKIKVDDEGKMNTKKKWTRTIKRHQIFQSRYKGKMCFPMGKLVWRFLYH